MITTDLTRTECFGHADVRIADDREMIAPSFEWLQCIVGHQLVVAAGRRRRKQELLCAPFVTAWQPMNFLDTHQARASVAVRCRECRQHGVQQR